MWSAEMPAAFSSSRLLPDPGSSRAGQQVLHVQLGVAGGGEGVEDGAARGPALGMVVFDRERRRPSWHQQHDEGVRHQPACRRIPGQSRGPGCRRLEAAAGPRTGVESRVTPAAPGSRRPRTKTAPLWNRRLPVLTVGDVEHGVGAAGGPQVGSRRPSPPQSAAQPGEFEDNHFGWRTRMKSPARHNFVVAQILQAHTGTGHRHGISTQHADQQANIRLRRSPAMRMKS